MFYQDLKDYGSPIDCYWNSSDTIKVKVTYKPDGWIVDTADCLVNNSGKCDFCVFLHKRCKIDNTCNANHVTPSQSCHSEHFG